VLVHWYVVSLLGERASDFFSFHLALNREMSGVAVTVTATLHTGTKGTESLKWRARLPFVSYTGDLPLFVVVDGCFFYGFL